MFLGWIMQSVRVGVRTLSVWRISLNNSLCFLLHICSHLWSKWTSKLMQSINVVWTYCWHSLSLFVMLSQEIHLQKTQMQRMLQYLSFEENCTATTHWHHKEASNAKTCWRKYSWCSAVDGGIEQLQTVFEGLQWQELPFCKTCC